jgi:hypothetical protein
MEDEGVKHTALWLIAALAAAGSAWAQTPGDGSAASPERQAAHAAVLKACDSELRTLCAAQHGREQMMCLRNNSDKLSAGCKDALSRLHRREAPANPPPQ